MVNYDLLNFN